MSGINSFWVDDKMYLIDDEVYESFRQLQVENEKLKEALEHIIEYWNGSENQGAMLDTLNEILDTTEQALQEI